VSISRANIGREIQMAGKKKVRLKKGGTSKKNPGKKNWMQKVTKSIKKRKTKGVCTGPKYGGPTCPPGSKRYNLATVFKKQAKKRRRA
tara:strand:+ start:642 stop:905 length:264 start_codon:yes stop_codon:yes gene_type:complete